MQSLYLVGIFIYPLLIAFVDGKLCMSCIKNVKDTKTYEYITKSSLNFYFHKAPISGDLRNCTLPNEPKFVECNGMCISVEAKISGTVVGYIFACGDRYKPYNLDSMRDGECRQRDQQVYMERQSLNTCVCAGEKCNMPEQESKFEEPSKEMTHHPKQVVSNSNSLAEKVPRDRKNSTFQYSFFGGFKRNGAGSNEVCKFAYFFMAVPILVIFAFF
uniref:Uncharacterized protein n=1 Tax=Acrobeloides nanus TaxID=290746 RepID=A0A914E994_9BILA